MDDGNADGGGGGDGDGEGYVIGDGDGDGDGEAWAAGGKAPLGTHSWVPSPHSLYIHIPTPRIALFVWPAGRQFRTACNSYKNQTNNPVEAPRKSDNV